MKRQGLCEPITAACISGGNVHMKKLVSSVLAASMVMSLAACGSTASTDSAADSSAASAASSAATTEAAGEGSGAYTGTPIKIGGIGPVTGGAAIYGQAVKNAEEMAVKEINAANGSDVFEWKFEDDEHDAEKSVNAYNTLKDWACRFWPALLPPPRPLPLPPRPPMTTCL